MRGNELWSASLLVGKLAIGSFIMKRLNITVSCVLMLVYLLVGMGGLAESVMCIGEDGHVGTKTADGESCDEFLIDTFLPNSPWSQTSTEDSFSGEESHCGPCVDIPVPSNSALHKSVSSKRTSKHMQKGNCATLVHTPRVFCQSIAGGSFLARPLETNSTLHSIRTVVLLI